jgi:hypothetical protein
MILTKLVKTLIHDGCTEEAFGGAHNCHYRKRLAQNRPFTTTDASVKLNVVESDTSASRLPLRNWILPKTPTQSVPGSTHDLVSHVSDSVLSTEQASTAILRGLDSSTMQAPVLETIATMPSVNNAEV